MSDPFAQHSGQYVNNFSEAENKRVIQTALALQQTHREAILFLFPQCKENVAKNPIRHGSPG